MLVEGLITFLNSGLIDAHDHASPLTLVNQTELTAMVDITTVIIYPVTQGFSGVEVQVYHRSCLLSRPLAVQQDNKIIK